MSLDYQYFKQICKKTDTNNEYIAYRPLGRPVILFSLVDGSPLASLHLVAKDAQCVITERPENCTDKDVQFQGLVNDNNKEFNLVISNLNPKGRIYFNIFRQTKTGTTTKEVPINAVNSLQPYMSYKIPCDKSTGKAMILRALEEKKTIVETEQEFRTAVDQEKKDVERKGTYLLLSVVPEKIGPLVTKFKKTKWRCADLIYIKRDLPRAPRTNVFGSLATGFRGDISGNISGSVNISGDIEVCGNLTRGINTVGNHLRNANPSLHSNPYDRSRATTRQTLYVENYTGDVNHNNMVPSFGDAETMDFGGPPEAMGDNSSQEEGAELFGSDSSRVTNVTAEDEFQDLIRGYRPNAERTREHCERRRRELMESPADQFQQALLNTRRGVPERGVVSLQGFIESTLQNETQGTLDVVADAQLDDVELNNVQDIGKSLSADIAYGQNVVENTAETWFEMAYDCMAESIVVGLSVMKNLQFMDASQEELAKDAEAEIQQLIDNGVKMLLKSLEKVFTSQDCVICLEPGPTTVFYQCGHQCCHTECAKTLYKCPLCRSYISAKLK